MATSTVVLLQGQQLLGTEGLVVDLRCRLNQILEMSTEQEVPEVNKLALVLVLDVDNAPPVLATANLFAVDNDRLLGTNDGKRNQALYIRLASGSVRAVVPGEANLNLIIYGALLIIKLVVVIGVHLEVVEGKLLLDALLEGLSLLQGQRVGLGNDGNNVDNIGQLLEHDNIDRLEGVSRRLDEEKAAVDAGILDVALTLSSELLSQIGGVLILDILDNGVPASVVVDQVSIPGGVNNVEPETDAILLDDVRNGLDLGGLADDFVGVKSTLGLDKVGGKDGVDQGRLSETSLACQGTHETR